MSLELALKTLALRKQLSPKMSQYLQSSSCSLKGGSLQLQKKQLHEGFFFALMDSWYQQLHQQMDPETHKLPNTERCPVSG